MNPRKSLSELQLSGSPNLSRVTRYAAKDAAKTLTDGQRAEVQKLDALIEETLLACTKGQTRRGRRNPAFTNLQTLIKSRKMIIEGKTLPPAPPSVQDMEAEIDELLAANKERIPS